VADVLFPEGGDQLSTNGKQTLNQYAPKLQQNANCIPPPAPADNAVAAAIATSAGDRWRPAASGSGVTSSAAGCAIIIYTAAAD